MTMQEELTQWMKAGKRHLSFYAYFLGFRELPDDENWNDDYHVYMDRQLGTGYQYEIKIYIPKDEDNFGEIAIGWLEAGTTDGKTPDYFEYLGDLDDKKNAIRNEETKLLLLGFPFEYNYRFDKDWKRELNEKNRETWGLTKKGNKEHDEIH